MRCRAPGAERGVLRGKRSQSAALSRSCMPARSGAAAAGARRARQTSSTSMPLHPVGAASARGPPAGSQPVLWPSKTSLFHILLWTSSVFKRRARARRLFLLDMLLGNADRLPCEALGWRGNAQNALYASAGRAAGRLVAIDSAVQRRPPGRPVRCVARPRTWAQGLFGSPAGHRNTG